MTDPACVFCRILAGAIPCSPVYADEHALAFLDIHPFEKGHTLVIPRYHAERLVDLPVDWLGRLMPAVQKTARLLLERMPCDGFNLLQSNGRCATQVVPHVHFHVIPRWNTRPIRWIGGDYDSPAEMQALAARLRGE
jgi:histidine triad (HIT) family protein